MDALGIKDIEKEVSKMEYMLDMVEKTGAWPCGEVGASKGLRLDLLTFAVYLAVSDKGISNRLLNFIYDVLGLKVDVTDVRSMVYGNYGSDDEYCDAMLNGMPDVIIDACDAEDELRSRGLSAEMSLPKKIAELYGLFGKAYLGNQPSKVELHAYGVFMMQMNSFLSREGYYD